MDFDIFISYSRKDFNEVNNFKKLLEDRIPSLNCWFDVTGIESGEEFDEKIISAINNSSFLLVAISDNSLKSDWVKKEVRYALNTGKIILPLLLKGAELKGWILFHIGSNDCTDISNINNVDKLLTRISSEIGKQLFSVSKPAHVVADYGIEMVHVQGGSFYMGNDNGQDDAKPVHEVTLDGFYIGKYTITQQQWKLIMGSNPSEFQEDRRPVENVSWTDTQVFLSRLNCLTGKNYRLPTEAEWEYAARGGNKSKNYTFAGGNYSASIGWTNKNSSQMTHNVGGKIPNELGIYDMSGNVWEWCHDFYNENYYQNSATHNPMGPESGKFHVLRGSSWNSFIEDLRYRGTDANPLGGDWEHCNNECGFRIVIDESAFNHDFSEQFYKPAIESLCSAAPYDVTLEYGLDMVYVEGGSFKMGIPGDRYGDEGPLHEVYIDSFYIGKYIATQELWEAVTGSRTSKVEGKNLPANRATWYDVQDFIDKLNQLTGRKFRLLTEAEWEYAAKGGCKSKGYKYSGSNDRDEVAWCDNCKEMQPVGLKKANELGIYDMSGNVYEWCKDFYSKDYYSVSPTHNPQGPEFGKEYVKRGGCWGGIHLWECSTTDRSHSDPSQKMFSDYTGFRLAVDAKDVMLSTDWIKKISEIYQDPWPEQKEISISENCDFDMTYIEGGDFLMGDSAKIRASPVHKVKLNSYYIGRHVVTQKLWNHIMDTNPSKDIGPDLPVHHVTWYEVYEFIIKLNEMTGLSFRLPTEAEWEYAAKGGSKEDKMSFIQSGDLYDFAWIKDNSSNVVHAVGTKRPNILGIYDMPGNVAEWCHDYYSEAYLITDEDNPTGPQCGEYRVIRGGGIDCSADECFYSYRSYNSPENRCSVGFRLVLDISDYPFTLETDNPGIADVYEKIGIHFIDANDYNKALIYCFKAMNIRESVLGINNTDTAVSYYNIGYIYGCLEEYNKALEFFLKTSHILEKNWGEEHLDTANCYSEIGYMYGCLEEYNKALEFHLKALATREKYLGEEHLDTASSYSNIGFVYNCLKEYYKALEFHLKALAIREKNLEKDHPHTAKSYYNIGCVYNCLKEYNKALEFHLKALVIREDKLGKEHLDTADSYSDIGCIYNCLEEYDKALESHFKALAIRKNKLGEEHLKPACSYKHIGSVYIHIQKYSRAYIYYLNALKTHEMILGKDNPQTIQIRKEIEKIGIHFIQKGKDEKKNNEFKDLLPYISNNKVGFINKNALDIIIPCKYDNVVAFYGDLAIVKLDNKYGFIDKLGNETTPCIYEKIDPFSEEFAGVKLNDKWGYVDKAGNETIPCKYEYAGSFSDDHAEVKLNGKWGYIDKTGNEVIPCKYEQVDLFNDGYAKVKLNGKWGYIDKSGNEIIPCKYEETLSFNDGMAPVKLNDKWGYIDKVGNDVIPCKYEKANNFAEGLASVTLKGVFDDGWGCIDTKGNEVIPFKYSYIESFNEGLAIVSRDLFGSCWGYVDKLGNEVIPCKYEEVEYFHGGIAKVKLNGKWGYIDKSGNEIIPCKYEEFKTFCEDMAEVKLNGKWGYIDKSGNEIIPCKYEETLSFNDGMAPVKLNDKWGYIDTTADVVIPFIYDEACIFRNGLAIVRINEKLACIDIFGNEK